MAGNPPLPAGAIISPEVDVTVQGAPSIAQPVANPTVEPSSGGSTTITATVQNIPDGATVGLGTGPQGGPYTDTGQTAVVAGGTATFTVSVSPDTSPTPEVVAYVVFYVPA